MMAPSFWIFGIMTDIAGLLFPADDAQAGLGQRDHFVLSREDEDRADERSPSLIRSMNSVALASPPVRTMASTAPLRTAAYAPICLATVLAMASKTSRPPCRPRPRAGAFPACRWSSGGRPFPGPSASS